MHLILLGYHRNCQIFFIKSPKEYLLAVRLKKNFEVAYLYLLYALFKSDCSFDNLKKPLDLILKYNDPIKGFKELKYDISACYKLIAEETLHRPYQSTDQAQPADTSDINIMPDNLNTCFDDWKERQEILAEIVYSLKDLSEKVKEMEGRHKFLGKIAKYETIISGFQVDSNGPSFDHFVQIFNDLQRHIEPTDLYEGISPNTEKLLALFEEYYINLYKWQFTDPSSFPKPMLAIISHQNLNKIKIFKLLKLPIGDLLQKAVKSLEQIKIENASSMIKNLETNFISTNSHDLSFILELCRNFENLESDLTPLGKWIYKVYLTLSK
jgi:hypothetical protein